MEFSFDIKDQSNVQHIQLKGNLIDKLSVTDLFEKVEDLVLDGNNNFVVDLKNVNYLNSIGLNILVNLLTKARNSGGDAVICNVSESINKLFIITKLNTVFSVFDDFGMALGHFGPKSEKVENSI